MQIVQGGDEAGRSNHFNNNPQRSGERKQGEERGKANLEVDDGPKVSPQPPQEVVDALKFHPRESPLPPGTTE